MIVKGEAVACGKMNAHLRIFWNLSRKDNNRLANYASFREF